MVLAGRMERRRLPALCRTPFLPHLHNRMLTRTRLRLVARALPEHAAARVLRACDASRYAIETRGDGRGDRGR